MTEIAPIRLEEALRRVIAELDGPIPREEFYRRVLAIKPSRAKKPTASIQSALCYGKTRRGLVTLDKDTYAPLQMAIQGIRFRIPLEQLEVNRGVLFVRPGFEPFLSRKAAEAVLLDEQGQRLPAPVVSIKQERKSPLGTYTSEWETFDLAAWLRAHKARRDDSVLLTLLNWQEATFQLAHEPYQRRQEQLITQQNQALADMLYTLMEDTVDERIDADEAVLTAYARLPAVRDYPGDHWLLVVDTDLRMRNTGYEIVPKDFRLPFERMLFGEEAVRELPFSSQEGKQVYRFKATFKGSKLPWRQIEILGNQTLIQLDSVMRDAFEHDPMDHLSEFTQVIPRGKGKKPREVDFGEINPFEATPANKLHIAGLGLPVGAELEYVYDFGDWIEHSLTLEAIEDPQPGVKYPRLAAQNEPRHASCERCQGKGRKANAVWICVDCSEEQQREVLICNKCLSAAHEGHYAVKIVY